MPASEAQIVANRRNAARSTGPKTAEGKERSRANAYKHGLTGDGVVLPDGDAAEVESRFAELQEELQPTGLSSRTFLRRFAVLSVRLERCERLDLAVYAKRVRHAAEDFVDQRLAQVEALAFRIDFEPMTVSRRLQATPEGIDWLIEQWGILRDDLLNRERMAWTQQHRARLERLLGRGDGNYRQTRPHALTETMNGFSQNINPSEVAGLNETEQVEWARGELLGVIDRETERLERVKAYLDPALIEQDRLEAADRALFDLQPAMAQVRKYEAATERGMYKALKEFRQIEAELKAAREADPDQELASFEPVAEPEEAPPSKPAPWSVPPADPLPETLQFPPKRNLDTVNEFFGHAANGIC